MKVRRRFVDWGGLNVTFLSLTIKRPAKTGGAKFSSEGLIVILAPIALPSSQAAAGNAAVTTAEQQWIARRPLSGSGRGGQSGVGGTSDEALLKASGGYNCPPK